MNIETAYAILFEGALLWFGVLILIMLIRAIIGPRITDRILAINMIGTMVSCCICILSSVLAESYLIDMALLYSMISFVTVLILAATYIAQKPARGRFAGEVAEEAATEKRWVKAYLEEQRRDAGLEEEAQPEGGTK